MRNKAMLVAFIVPVAMFSLTPQAANGQLRWFTVYYPTWAMGDLGQANFIIPPNEVDWTGITHVVHFGNGNVSTTPPYFSPVTSANDSIEWSFNGIANPGCGPTCWRNWQDTLIRTAHRKGD